MRRTLAHPSTNRGRRDWREALVASFARRRVREELVPGVLVGIGGLVGLVIGACALVLVSAPPPLLRPAEGLTLLARVALVVPLPTWACARLALRVGEQVVRRSGSGRART